MTPQRDRPDPQLPDQGVSRPLTTDEATLVDAARRVIDDCTDAPDVESDGVHTVGAAVRTADGRIHTGVNLFHFTGGPCAELVALATARAQGGRDPQCIVAVGNHGRGVLAPCGRDRQVLLDLHPSCRVIVPAERGLESVPVTSLLPRAYVRPDTAD